MAEIELAVSARRCLNRRVLDLEHLCREACAWEWERNGRGMLIHWRFIIADARDRLGRLCGAKSS